MRRLYRNDLSNRLSNSFFCSVEKEWGKRLCKALKAQIEMHSTSLRFANEDLLAQEEEGIALKLVVKKVTVKIMGHMTALNHEQFASDSYDMLGAEQRHKCGLTAAGSKVNSCPFLLPTVMMDSGFAHCSFGFAGCFRKLRHCVQTSRISITGNPICSQVTGNTYSS